MAKRLCQITYESPIGDLAIVASDQAIIQISLVQSSDFNKDENAHQLCLNCQKQLEEYFSGERETFDLPIAYEGTPFQQKVWKALQNVPYGAVTNYKVLAINQDSVTVKLGGNTFKAGIGEILTEGEVKHNEVSNLNKKFGGEKR